MKWPVKKRHTFLKPSGGQHPAAVARPLAKLRLYVCQCAWLLLRLCCMIGAFLAIWPCGLEWNRCFFFFLKCLTPMALMETQCLFICDNRVKMVRVSCGPQLTYTDSVSGDHSSVSTWQFSGVEAFKCVLNKRESSLMLALQTCWCVLWDQWSGLVIFNQMSWQIYSPPLRGLLTLWRGTLALPRSR